MAELRLPPDVVARTEIAGPGFINFWLAEDQLAAAHRRILAEGPPTAGSPTSEPLKVNVEFVSANPTGPLHVGHGRGAALGDAIAALLEWTGHSVTREFYINDAGVQIDRVAQSLWARVRQEAGHERDDSRGRLSRRVPSRERPRRAGEGGTCLRRSPRGRGRSPVLARLGAPDAARGAGSRPGRLRRAVRRHVLGAGGLRRRQGRARARRCSPNGA